MKYSAKLRSKLHEFKISKRSLSLLREAGIRTIHYSNGYAHVNYQGSGMRLHSLLMLLLGHDLKGMEVDHKNRNKLDNRISNLRISTRAQNMGNIGARKKNSHGFKGIYFHRGIQRWAANIGSPTKYLGSFKTKNEAAAAYNAAAKKYFGKFAKLNKIPK